MTTVAWLTGTAIRKPIVNRVSTGWLWKRTIDAAGECCCQLIRYPLGDVVGAVDAQSGPVVLRHAADHVRLRETANNAGSLPSHPLARPSAAAPARDRSARIPASWAVLVTATGQTVVASRQGDTDLGDRTPRAVCPPACAFP